ncbi:hypothetical protein ZIOFF_026603 [Zingiber officinale]|uniref:Auxin response factor domain-containing protein n=1 Tax=Zingiber officinale TaxID=94328 RepID=A0A8J5LFX1_ZINOF|nr:hypothetical protein ZIOFF_026603 [Zingiber officinale]
MDLSTAMWTAAVVNVVAVYWFVWVMGSAEVKGKRAVNLKMRSIRRDKVQDKYKQYWSFFLRSKERLAPLTPSCSGGLSGPSSPPAYLPFLMQDKAAAEDGEKETFSSFPKQSRHCEVEMPLTDSEEDSFLFPVEEIVQYPLTGYVAPSSISFNPDGRLISYLFGPDGTLHRKVFAFDVASRRQELVFCLPDGGGLDENNLSAEEKLRRERSRERGLGVTRYEWKSRSTSSSCSTPGKPTIMVPLPNGKRDAPLGEKPEPVRMHLRNMIIVPEMIGSIIGVYNGKTFNQVEIKPEMIGHYLAEFSISYKPVKHGRPGIGATHSSRYMGTVIGISDLDPVRWPNSYWRSVKVGWDESTSGERQPRVSLWEIEPLTTFPMYPSSFPLRLKRPWPSDLPSLHGGRDDLMWLRDGDRAIQSLNFQGFCNQTFTECYFKSWKSTLTFDDIRLDLTLKQV